MTASRRVFKALSIFGSVQMITMLCAVVRTKCVALWLGTAGIGVFGLYSSAIEVINNLVQLNIRQSGVREIASASPSRREMLVVVVRRLGGILGIVGAILTVVLSPLLSELTFGDSGHTLQFVLLALAIFCNALIAGEQAVLQATQRLRRLALASLWGAVVATFVSILFIKFLGMDGIVPSFLSYAVVTAVAYYLFRKDVKWDSGPIKKTVIEGTPILKLGIYITAAAFTTVFAQYLFIVWMRHESGNEGVGLYQSGYTIITQYVGLVFTALAVEFYPRLSGVIDSRHRVSLFVRHEMLFLLWGLLGFIVLFINICPLIVKLLYDDSFISVTGYLSIASVGTVFKAISFVMAFVILAKGDGRIYLVTESVSSILYVLLSVAGYKLGGLAGIGVGYVIWYMLYTLSVFLVYHFRYKLSKVGRPLMLSLPITAIVATQALLCIGGYFLVATTVSAVVFPLAMLVLYFKFLKRRTVKE